MTDKKTGSSGWERAGHSSKRGGGGGGGSWHWAAFICTFFPGF